MRDPSIQGSLGLHDVLVEHRFTEQAAREGREME
jgi:hypothetical protein